MEITCFNCMHTWRLSKGQFLVARLRFVFGDHEHTFICPNCHAGNVISKQEFEASDSQIPVTGGDPQAGSRLAYPPRAGNDGSPPPTNPVTAPKGTARRVQAVVLQSGLPLRRDHKANAETVDTMKQGERVTILDTWTDGENLWVQFGPERWAAIDQDGDALIELLEV